MKSIPTRIGQYDVIDKLGEGLQATVFKAKDSINGEDVAVKVIKSDAAITEREHFAREMNILQSMKPHKHVM